MRFIQQDYMEYLSSMEEKDYIIVDPPWKYVADSWSNQLNYNLWRNNVEGVSYILQHTRASILFIWVTNSMLLDVFRAYDKIEHSFIYKTLVTWVKKTRYNKLSCGLGYSFRNTTEHIMVFQRRDSKSVRLNMRTVFEGTKGKLTCKPKDWEYSLLKALQNKGMKKGAYIFSGVDVSSFKDFDIDCIDIREYVENNPK